MVISNLVMYELLTIRKLIKLEYLPVEKKIAFHFRYRNVCSIKSIKIDICGSVGINLTRNLAEVMKNLSYIKLKTWIVYVLGDAKQIFVMC